MTAPADHLLAWLPRLRRYARALARSREDADDLVQDTLERAWARPALWAGVADMRAWLFGIMHNVNADRLRRPGLDLVDAGDTPPEPAVAPDAPGRLALRDMQAALDRLPPEQREVLLLVTLEELSYAETARALDLPIGTVMSRLSRARERLRQLLDEPAPARPARAEATAARLRVVRGEGDET
ncbi:RNA polymerase sigma factor [Derxia gummosa]|uniref:RNA polymerase sigma factor n=1 Tax=Derxia gummosa DSM 723 TaxID=1121388 RepID=A0A8B6X576_9BURK|nr:RNA polymerase sigma factor [Derxia gummosa]